MKSTPTKEEFQATIRVATWMLNEIAKKSWWKRWQYPNSTLHRIISVSAGIIATPEYWEEKEERK